MKLIELLNKVNNLIDTFGGDKEFQFEDDYGDRFSLDPAIETIEYNGIVVIDITGDE